MEPLALTFDDGPDRRSTPALLDVLSAAGVQATFFVIAPRAAAHPELVARATEDGHAIGLHCDEHARHSAHDEAWCRADTAVALRRLAALGLAPTLWRTPWGDRAPWTNQVAAEHGLRLVGWTVDTHDWRGDSASAMYAATVAQLRPGAVVLAHDGIGPGAQRDDALETVDYVERVAEHTRRLGLRLAALS